MTAVSLERGPSTRIALVLAGGAARGAYEVGVIQHVLEQVSRDVGREIPLEILCGTSVGAINVCALAAFADQPRERAARLVHHWTSLRMDELLRPDGREILGLVRGLFGRIVPDGRRGAIIDPAGLERAIAEAIPFERIDEHLRAGRLRALTLSATEIATGRTVVFVQQAERAPLRKTGDPTTVYVPAQIRLPHALASAAIPLLFPPVAIEGRYYCDGGLRQNVPLSPARRLGADGLLVVNPRFIREGTEPVPGVGERPPGPLFLLGKALNALLLDRIDADIDRLERINRILEAGRRSMGPNFVDDLNRAMGYPPGSGLKPLRAVLVRASQDIGRMSAEFVRSTIFARRYNGVLGRLMRRLAEGEAESEADLLSYLLFDGEFAGQLIELGRSDARAQHADLCALFDAQAAALPDAFARDRR